MCSALFACDKLPANGDLDGMWQVVEIEHGGEVKNVASEQVYMSIQLRLFMLGSIDIPRRYYGYFEHKGDSMHLWQFSFASTNESDADDNKPIAEEETYRLNPWGFYSLDERFKVEKLTGSQLILRNETSRIHFIKF